MIPVIGLGAGGHAKVVIEILKLTGKYELVGLLERDQQLWGSKILNVPVLGSDDLLPQLWHQGVNRAFIGLGTVGNSTPRIRLYHKVQEHGFQVVDAIHPKATISPSTEIGNGLTVMANATINSSVFVGDNVIINTGAIIDHDCQIQDHVHIATGACLAGGVFVDTGTHIGIGASIIQGIKIGANTIVGAGAVVIDNLPDGVVAVGVPAKILKVNEI